MEGSDARLVFKVTGGWAVAGGRLVFKVTGGWAHWSGGGTQAHRMIKYLPVVVGWLVGGWVSLLGLWEEYILAYVYFMFLWWWWARCQELCRCFEVEGCERS